MTKRKQRWTAVLVAGAWVVTDGRVQHFRMAELTELSARLVANRLNELERLVTIAWGLQ